MEQTCRRCWRRRVTAASSPTVGFQISFKHLDLSVKHHGCRSEEEEARDAAVSPSSVWVHTTTNAWYFTWIFPFYETLYFHYIWPQRKIFHFFTSLHLLVFRFLKTEEPEDLTGIQRAPYCDVKHWSESAVSQTLEPSLWTGSSPSLTGFFSKWNT